jgi:hypothetical protein
MKVLPYICGNESIAIYLWQQNHCHMEWKHPRTIIGPPAEGESYFKRPEISDQFWIAISKGEFVRFTAPRRVGKSSVMKDLENYPQEGMLVIYQNIESNKTSNQFYKRLWHLIVDKMEGTKLWSTKFLKWYEGKKIGEVSIKELKVKIDTVQVDFKTELLELIETLGDEKSKLVLLLDEFPDVLMSIKKNEGEHAASDVLHTVREIRHNKKIKNFHFVFAGSIGLQHVVAKIDRTKVINDLKPIEIPQLSMPEANSFLDMLLYDATIKMAEKEKIYLLDKVGHLLPYFLQLMIAQCDEIAYKETNPVVATATIDRAFAAVVANNENFSDWEKRLLDYMAKSDYDYCIGVLTRCAHQKYTIQEAYAYSKKINPETGYKELIDDVLVKDGYLVYEDNVLNFLSPFLLSWWQNRHPKFEIED